MAFAIAWDETSPDGDIVHVSGLDDSDRGIKTSIRERLEGDTAEPDLTGLIEVGSWPTAPKPRKGTARAYVDTAANILAYTTAQREDGRIAFATDAGVIGGPRVYHVATAAVAEIGYLNIDGSRDMQGPLTVNPDPATVSGPAQFGMNLLLTTSSAATTQARAIIAKVATAAAAFTCPSADAIYIAPPGIGAGSAITAVSGVHIDNQIGGAVNCYGVKIEDQAGGVGQFAIYTGAGPIRFGDVMTVEQSLSANKDLLILHNNNVNGLFNPQLTFKANGIALATLAGRSFGPGTAGQLLFSTTGSGGPPSGGQTGPEIQFKPGGVQALDMYGDGTVLIGANGPIATDSVAGFACIAKCAGTPTGVPTAYYLGWAPIIYDETGKKLWVRDSPTATWKGVVMT